MDSVFFFWEIFLENPYQTHPSSGEAVVSIYLASTSILNLETTHQWPLNSFTNIVKLPKLSIWIFVGSSEVQISNHGSLGYSVYQATVHRKFCQLNFTGGN